MAGTLPATPNLERRLRLFGMTTNSDDIREGAPIELNIGLADLGTGIGGMTGFAVEASNPALVGVGSYTEPVFGAGGGVAGGPFAVDVHPEDGGQSQDAPHQNQILVAVAHDGATFIMDFRNSAAADAYVQPGVAQIGQEFNLAEDPDNGAWFVDSSTAGAGTAVRIVDVKFSNLDLPTPDSPGITGSQFDRVEVVVLTPELNG